MPSIETLIDFYVHELYLQLNDNPQTVDWLAAKKLSNTSNKQKSVQKCAYELSVARNKINDLNKWSNQLAVLLIKNELGKRE